MVWIKILLKPSNPSQHRIRDYSKPTVVMEQFIYTRWQKFTSSLTESEHEVKQHF